MSRQPSSSRPRGGFTLVEMLVVIAIIAIIAAVSIPAVMGAIRRANNAAIMVEITSLAQAIEEYKNKYGDYPVDFTEAVDYSAATSPLTSTLAGRHLRKVSRRAGAGVFTATYQAADITNITNSGYLEQGGSVGVSAGDNILNQLDAAEALVFCLRGYSDNVANPWGGTGGPLDFDPNTTRDTIFTFNETQLVDVDGDGFPVYMPKHGPATPYVYFESRQYASAAARFNRLGLGEARPYATTQVTAPTTLAEVEFANPQSFQIICAGLDGDYGAFTAGAGATRKAFPDGLANGAIIEPYTRRRDDDNLTSFSEGILEDRIPD